MASILDGSGGHLYDDVLGLPDRHDVSAALNSGGWIEYDDMLVEAPDDGDFTWQIEYSFPNEPHDNIVQGSGKAYGSRIPQAELYELLCDMYYGGQSFLDDYFTTVYPRSALKDTVDRELAGTKEYLVGVAEAMIGKTRLTRAGTWDRRYKASAQADDAWQRYKEYADEWMRDEGEILAAWIKADIISAMETGILPAQRRLPSPATMERRERAGLEPVPFLYATGSLIRSLRLKAVIGGSGRWRTRQGIRV